jgi:hypothetical protein
LQVADRAVEHLCVSKDSKHALMGTSHPYINPCFVRHNASSTSLWTLQTTPGQTRMMDEMTVDVPVGSLCTSFPLHVFPVQGANFNAQSDMVVGLRKAPTGSEPSGHHPLAGAASSNGISSSSSISSTTGSGSGTQNTPAAPTAGGTSDGKNCVECVIFDIHGQEKTRLSDVFSRDSHWTYSYTSACFSPRGDTVLANGVLWDIRTPSRGANVVHQFDKLSDIGVGSFHPRNSNEVILNSAVWDIRTFRLLKMVPSLDQCIPKFSANGSVIYAFKRFQGDVFASQPDFSVSDSLLRRLRQPLLAKAFKVLDGEDYMDIETVELERPIVDLAVDPTDCYISVVEQIESALNTSERIQKTSCRLYEVGRRKPEEADSDNDDADDEDDDPDDQDEDDWGGHGVGSAGLNGEDGNEGDIWLNGHNFSDLPSDSSDSSDDSSVDNGGDFSDTASDLSDMN